MTSFTDSRRRSVSNRKTALAAGVALMGAASALQAVTLQVPGDFPTIAAAIGAAAPNDTIEVAPGEHSVPDTFSVTTPITLASWLHTRNDPAARDTTILTGSGSRGFVLEGSAAGTRIIGFTFREMTKPINPAARDVEILNNRFVNGGSDQIDFEVGGSGRVADNVFENASDEAVDLDGDSEVIIERNVMNICGDDCIEIRFHAVPGDPITIVIRDNIITGANRDGIQMMPDPDGITPRSLVIHNNIISGGMAGIACMDNFETREDLSGCAMDERVVVYNNTILDNQVGITGGDNMVVVNNIIAGNGVGVRRVDGGSIVDSTVFANTTDVESSVLGPNVYFRDPGLDPADNSLLENSSSIDAGTAQFSWNGEQIFDLTSNYAGLAPDLGAIEFGMDPNPDPDPGNQPPFVSAGDDLLLLFPDSMAAIEASVVDDDPVTITWSLEGGPPGATIDDPAAATTFVRLSHQGRYILKVTASDGELSSTDTLVITYANDARNGDFIISAPATLLIEAEDYQVLGGGARVVQDSEASAAAALEISDSRAFAEYELITTREGYDYYLWVRLSGQGDMLNASLDNGVERVLHRPSGGGTALSWLRLPQPFSSPAGQYTLRLRALNPDARWDATYVTTDTDFTPPGGAIAPEPDPVADDDEQTPATSTATSAVTPSFLVALIALVILVRPRRRFAKRAGASGQLSVRRSL